MTHDAGITYSLAATSLPLVVIRKSGYAGVVLGTCILMAGWAAGALPFFLLPFGEVFLVAGAVGTYQFGSLQFKRGYIVVTPACFVNNTGLSRQEVLWGDVASVAVERYEPKGRVGRVVTALVFGGEGTLPFVKIGLRRSRFVGGIPGMRSIALYPKEPERFVQDAQQHLTPQTG